MQKFVHWLKRLALFQFFISSLRSLFRLPLLFIRQFVKHSVVFCEIATTWSKIALMLYLRTCVLLIWKCRLDLSFFEIWCIVEKLFVIDKIFFDRVSCFKWLASFGQICVQFLFPYEFLIIIRILCIFEGLGLLILKHWE